jgi:[ribosomal protein S18]-alanine N-acetyltransferase
MTAVLSPMTLAHLAEVMPHEDAVFGPEAWSPDAYRAELADRRHRYYLVAHDAAGRFTGWAGLMVVADTAQLLTVGVVPAARRQGVARALVDALIAEARRRAAVEMILEVRVDNTAARTLYDDYGFTPLRVRRGYYENGRVDAVEMRLELSSR